MEKTRRAFLSCAAVAATAGLVAPRQALALRVEDLDVPRQRLILDACETRNAHQRVLADLMAELEGRGVGEVQARETAQQMNCPFCGCGLAAAVAGELPDAQTAPRF
ncbi:MAG: hypothetical protein ACK5U4_01695 [Rhodospirillales bacterium]|jgi:hypothetical protein|nr:hypothetical protein [Magnetospirillum sp.]